jgi:hypothetical protein
MLKIKTKFLQANGGTLRIHRRNPFEGTVWSVGPILDFPENALAEPNFGYRQIRQSCNIWQSAILTRETIFKIFEKS